MKWNVYRFDINRQKIVTFNIFDHGSFLKYVKKAANKLKTKEEFSEQLKRELMYYFWSKAEHELIIEITEDNYIFLIPFVGCREPEKVKIDVTDDANFDWIEFAEIHTKRQIHSNKAKIDIYDQVMFNWNEFIDFCWDNKKELLKYE